MRAPAPVVLVAEDDEDDRVLLREAVREGALRADLRFVGDGADALAYLRRQGRWADPAASPAPRLLLLDLNMPRVGGAEALRRLKADPALRRLPVVVLSTARDPEEVARCYSLGAASYLAKPADFSRLVETVRLLLDYWTRLSAAP